MAVDEPASRLRLFQIRRNGGERRASRPKLLGNGKVSKQAPTEYSGRSPSVLPWLSAQTAWIRDDKIRKVNVITGSTSSWCELRSPLEPGGRSLISLKALSKMVWE
jgi:hypothetical protein